MIFVCVPVLKRYDLLREMLVSLERSNVEPTAVYVIDNGLDSEKMDAAVDGFLFPIIVHTPIERMGLAESWNWFIDHVSEERLIVNDDISFAPGSLGQLVAESHDFVSCGFGFSCFLLRDACVRKVGRFDETISPGYAYFEDMDYLRRMKTVGIVDKVIGCDVEHRQSATPALFSPEEWNAHHARFQLAQDNYTNKWRDAPSWDQLAAIGGAGANA